MWCFLARLSVGSWNRSVVLLLSLVFSSVVWASEGEPPLPFDVPAGVLDDAQSDLGLNENVGDSAAPLASETNEARTLAVPNGVDPGELVPVPPVVSPAAISEPTALESTPLAAPNEEPIFFEPTVVQDNVEAAVPSAPPEAVAPVPEAVVEESVTPIAPVIETGSETAWLDTVLQQARDAALELIMEVFQPITEAWESLTSPALVEEQPPVGSVGESINEPVEAPELEPSWLEDLVDATHNWLLERADAISSFWEITPDPAGEMHQAEAVEAPQVPVAGATPLPPPLPPLPCPDYPKEFYYLDEATGVVELLPSVAFSLKALRENTEDEFRDWMFYNVLHRVTPALLSDSIREYRNEIDRELTNLENHDPNALARITSLIAKRDRMKQAIEVLSMGHAADLLTIRYEKRRELSGLLHTDFMKGLSTALTNAELLNCRLHSGYIGKLARVSEEYWEAVTPYWTIKDINSLATDATNLSTFGQKVAQRAKQLMTLPLDEWWVTKRVNDTHIGSAYFRDIHWEPALRQKDPPSTEREELEERVRYRDHKRFVGLIETKYFQEIEATDRTVKETLAKETQFLTTQVFELHPKLVALRKTQSIGLLFDAISVMEEDNQSRDYLPYPQCGDYELARKEGAAQYLSLIEFYYAQLRQKFDKEIKDNGWMIVSETNPDVFARVIPDDKFSEWQDEIQRVYLQFTFSPIPVTVRYFNAATNAVDRCYFTLDMLFEEAVLVPDLERSYRIIVNSIDEKFADLSAMVKQSDFLDSLGEANKSVLASLGQIQDRFQTVALFDWDKIYSGWKANSRVGYGTYELVHSIKNDGSLKDKLGNEMRGALSRVFDFQVRGVKATLPSTADWQSYQQSIALAGTLRLTDDIVTTYLTPTSDTPKAPKMIKLVRDAQAGFQNVLGGIQYRSNEMAAGWRDIAHASMELVGTTFGFARAGQALYLLFSPTMNVVLTAVDNDRWSISQLTAGFGWGVLSRYVGLRVSDKIGSVVNSLGASKISTEAAKTLTSGGRGGVLASKLNALTERWGFQATTVAAKIIDVPARIVGSNYVVLLMDDARQIGSSLADGEFRNVVSKKVSFQSEKERWSNAARPLAQGMNVIGGTLAAIKDLTSGSGQRDLLKSAEGLVATLSLGFISVAQGATYRAKARALAPNQKLSYNGPIITNGKSLSISGMSLPAYLPKGPLTIPTAKLAPASFQPPGTTGNAVSWAPGAQPSSSAVTPGTVPSSVTPGTVPSVLPGVFDSVLPAVDIALPATLPDLASATPRESSPTALESELKAAELGGTYFDRTWRNNLAIASQEDAVMDAKNDALWAEACRKLPPSVGFLLRRTYDANEQPTDEALFQMANSKFEINKAGQIFARADSLIAQSGMGLALIRNRDEAKVPISTNYYTCDGEKVVKVEENNSITVLKLYEQAADQKAPPGFADVSAVFKKADEVLEEWSKSPDWESCRKQLLRSVEGIRSMIKRVEADPVLKALQVKKPFQPLLGIARIQKMNVGADANRCESGVNWSTADWIADAKSCKNEEMTGLSKSHISSRSLGFACTLTMGNFYIGNDFVIPYQTKSLKLDEVIPQTKIVSTDGKTLERIPTLNAIESKFGNIFARSQGSAKRSCFAVIPIYKKYSANSNPRNIPCKVAAKLIEVDDSDPTYINVESFEYRNAHPQTCGCEGVTLRNISR